MDIIYPSGLRLETKSFCGDDVIPKDWLRDERKKFAIVSSPLKAD